jgi:hypothetical protein
VVAKIVADSVLDAALNILKNNATIMTVCSTAPTNRTEAVTTYALADVAMTSTDYTLADGDAGDGNGRKVTTAAKNAVTVDASGTATHIALCDSSNLLFVAPCGSQQLYAGNTVNIPPQVFQIADPSSGVMVWEHTEVYTAWNGNGWEGPFVPAWTGLTDTTGKVDLALVDNGIWNASGVAAHLHKQTIWANNPGRFQVTANADNGNTEVLTFPYGGINFIAGTRLSQFTQITSSFSQRMNGNANSINHAMFDIWFGSWNNEVMIQLDFADLSTIEEGTQVGVYSFGGSNGVPVQNWTFVTESNPWSFCLTDASRNKVNEQTGTVDLLAMLNWIVSHGYLAANLDFQQIGFGWEIQSTGGVDQTFEMLDLTFTLH